MNSIKLVAAVTGLLLFLAFFQTSIRECVSTLFAAASTVLEAGIRVLKEWTGRLRQALERELTKQEMAGDRWRGAYVVGGVVHTTIFLFLAVVDFHSMALTMDAMMGTDGALGFLEALPFQVEATLALAVLLTAVYAGWMVKELLGSERAALIPLQHYSKRARGFLLFAAVTSFALALVVIYTGGWFRGDVLTQEDSLPTSFEPLQAISLATLEDNPAPAQPSGDSDSEWTIRITMWGLPVALTLAALVAFVGPALLMRLLVPAWLAWILLTTSSARITLRILRVAISWMHAVVGVLLELVLRLGTIVARPPITLMRLMHGWAVRQVRLSQGRPALSKALIGILTGCVRVLTSWSLDVEVPVSPIGQHSPEVTHPATEEALRA